MRLYCLLFELPSTYVRHLTIRIMSPAPVLFAKPPYLFHDSQPILYPSSAFLYLSSYYPLGVC